MSAEQLLHHRLDPTWPEEVGAALAIGTLLFLSPLLRPWYRRWGATDAETGRPLPGDDLVPDPNLSTTRAVEIHAPAELVWPWLVQLGQGRGGLYSYTRLENLVGCDIHNASEVILAYQKLEIGDVIRLAPGNAPFFEVALIEPCRALVLRGGGPQMPGAARPSWAFYLDQVGDNVTRLIARYRMHYPSGVGNCIVWRGIMDPLFFVMERRMLLGIQQRAERHARQEMSSAR
jgi:hypothetical protein